MPEKWFWAIGYSAFCVFIECVLNIGGQLVWEYPFWNLSFKGIWLIFFFGYFHFFCFAILVISLKSMKGQTDDSGNNIRCADCDEYPCFRILGLEILKTEFAVFVEDLIVFFVNHFAVEFPEFRQHLFLLIFAEVFLTGIKEMFIFFFDVLGIKIAQFPC